MIKITHYIFLLFLIGLGACSKTEFTLFFDLDEGVTDNYNVTYFATDTQGGLTVQAVASVQKGKCELKGYTKRPTLVYLSSKKSKLPLVIYTSREDEIMIHGKGSNPLQWEVEGNEINEQISAWRMANENILLNDDKTALNESVENYAAQNPESAAAFIITLVYFNRRADNFKYVAVMDGFRNLPDKSTLIGLAAQADQLDNSLAYPARIESMIMKSSRNIPDTIIFNGKNPGFLIFWNSDLKEKKEIRDSLKSLVKAYPDSASRILADINLDSDSTAWRNAIKKDSLNSVKRLWAPASLTDKTLMKLKVGSVPYYIVADSAGRQVYRGDELDVAIKNFQDQMSRKDSIAAENNKEKR